MFYTTVQKVGDSSPDISVQEYGQINEDESVPEANAGDVLLHHNYKCQYPC